MTEQTLLEQINADLKIAMKEKDEVAKRALRSLKTGITEAEKASDNHEIDQAATLAVVTKAAKQRRDSIAEYEKAGRTDLVAEEEAELAVLERYLPEQLSEARIEEIVRAVIAETGAESARDLGKVMPGAMARTKGKADGKTVNQIARRLLSS